MHREVLSKYDSITVGEMPGVSDENEILRTVGADAGELNMIFIFDVVDIDKPNVRMALKPWDLKEMKSIITRWQRCMIERNGWNSVFIENHDNPRSVSRYADDSDEYRHKGAKLLALMQTTLGGTIFVYQGEEIGIRNAPTHWDIDEEYRDIETLNYWKKVQQIYKNNPEKLAEGRKIIHMKARDHARTPMQWDTNDNAGFCKPDVKPWMRVMDDYKDGINAESQMQVNDMNELSTWQFWQRCLKHRKIAAEVFVYGDYEEILHGDPNVFAYLRTGSSGASALVVLNFSGKTVDWTVPDNIEIAVWIVSNYVKDSPSKPSKGTMSLEPWEGLVAKCKKI